MKRFPSSILLVWTLVAVMCLTIVLLQKFELPKRVARAHGNLPAVHLIRELHFSRDDGSSTLDRLVYNDAATALAWSPSGQQLAGVSNYGRQLTIWDLQHDKATSIALNAALYVHDSLAFVSDDLVLAPPRRSPPKHHWAFSLWDTRSGILVKDVEGAYSNEDFRADAPRAYAVSADHALAISIATLSGEVRLGTEEFESHPVIGFSTASWAPVVRYPVPAVGRVAVSHDSKHIAFGTFYNDIFIYELNSAAPVDHIDTREKDSVEITALDYSPDDQYLAVAGGWGDGAAKWLKVYRLSDHQIIATYPGYVGARRMAWSQLGNCIAFLDQDHHFRLWDPFRPQDPGTVIDENSSASFALSRQGTKVAIGNANAVKIYELRDR